MFKFILKVVTGLRRRISRKHRYKATEQSVGKVLLPILNSPGKYTFLCPGCHSNHVIDTNPGDKWTYHTIIGDLYKPTIRASILSQGDPKQGKPHCHAFITNGKIEFLYDCTHEMAGKTVALPAIG